MFCVSSRVHLQRFFLRASVSRENGCSDVLYVPRICFSILSHFPCGRFAGSFLSYCEARADECPEPWSELSRTLRDVFCFFANRHRHSCVFWVMRNFVYHGHEHEIGLRNALVAWCVIGISHLMLHFAHHSPLTWLLERCPSHTLVDDGRVKVVL